MMELAYVITTCGKKKAQHAAPAEKFYLGSFTQLQRRTARALQPREGILILSNKYGFMAPDYVIPGPYDSHWGYPDTLDDDSLREQVSALNLFSGDVVVCLGAAEYSRQTRRLFPSDVRVIWPAAHLPNRGMGYQVQMFQAMGIAKKLPDRCLRQCEVLQE